MSDCHQQGALPTPDSSFSLIMEKVLYLPLIWRGCSTYPWLFLLTSASSCSLRKALTLSYPYCPPGPSSWACHSLHLVSVHQECSGEWKGMRDKNIYIFFCTCTCTISVELYAIYCTATSCVREFVNIWILILYFCAWLFTKQIILNVDR